MRTYFPEVAPLFILMLFNSGCSGASSESDTGTWLGDTNPGQCVRSVLKADVVNARDLGGNPLSGNRRVLCLKVLRGGDLCNLSPSGCAEFTKLGIKTVIDLRMKQVQQSAPPPGCVTKNAKLVSAPMPKLLPDTPSNYLALMSEKAAVAALFTALGDSSSYPVYMHCVIGRDRVSFLTALVLLALDASRKTVTEEFMLSEKTGVSVKQPCIVSVLDEINKRGGIDAYLTSVGVTSAQLAALRTRAREK